MKKIEEMDAAEKAALLTSIADVFKSTTSVPPSLMQSYVQVRKLCADKFAEILKSIN